MGALSRGLLVGVCTVLLAAVFTDAAAGEAASMVVGLAKCADCTRKNMKAEAVFKGTFLCSNYAILLGNFLSFQKLVRKVT